ncbi:hypothetical protein ACQJBY_066365 [Aegilops geniculata]
MYTTAGESKTTTFLGPRPNPGFHPPSPLRHQRVDSALARISGSCCSSRWLALVVTRLDDYLRTSPFASCLYCRFPFYCKTASMMLQDRQIDACILNWVLRCLGNLVAGDVYMVDSILIVGNNITDQSFIESHKMCEKCENRVLRKLCFHLLVQGYLI